MAQHSLIQTVNGTAGESGYVAECLNLAVITEGATLGEAAQNLLKAIRLDLEGEDPPEMWTQDVRARGFRG